MPKAGRGGRALLAANPATEDSQAGLWGADHSAPGATGGVRDRVRVLQGRQVARPTEVLRAARLGKPVARLAGNGRMIQITAQMRVLVAIEPVDGFHTASRWRNWRIGAG